MARSVAGQRPSATPNRPPWIARAARRPRTADGGPSGLLRNVPPPSERWPRASGGPERTGKGAETTQLAPRMIRPAVTLTRDLVRRRHPTGASPSRRNAPGRTLSPMPSEQKGAYGGHLALFSPSSVKVYLANATIHVGLGARRDKGPTQRIRRHRGR